MRSIIIPRFRQSIMRASARLPVNERVLSTQTKPDSTSPKSPRFGDGSGFDFKELGASRPVKTVIIVFLSIATAVESIGWYTFFKRKYFGATEGEGEGNGVKHDE